MSKNTTTDNRSHKISVPAPGIQDEYAGNDRVHGRILIIETSSIGRAGKTALKREGFTVTAVKSFSEAVKTSQNIHYDMIIMEVDNTELLNMHLAQFPPSMTALIVADRSLAESLAENTGGGIHSFMFTPVDPEKLKKAVGQAISRSHLVKEYIRNDVLIELGVVKNELAIETGIENFMESVVRVGMKAIRADYISLEITGVDSTRHILKTEIGVVRKKWNEVLHNLEESNEPVVIYDTIQDSSETVDFMRESGISSIIRVPLETKSNVRGVITGIKTKETGVFVQSDLSFVSILAFWAAMAIDNARTNMDYFKEHIYADRLLDHISFAQENERKRVAVEIHDGVAQWLVGASYDIKLCSALISDSNYSELEQTIDKVKNILQKSVKELRRAISNLPMPSLEENGLTGVIFRLAEKLEEEGIKCIVHIPDDIPSLTTAQKKTLYWVVQESLTNIQKHAHATRVEISIEIIDNTVFVNVTDNGSGFNIEETVKSKFTPEHIGLFGMKERVDYLDGIMNIDSEPGKGTSVDFSFSLLPPELVNIART